MTWSTKIKTYSDNHSLPDIDIKALAQQFCEATDEQQAQFFIECAKIAKEWDGDEMTQWYAIGRHMKTCICSTEEARDMVRALYRGVQ